MANSQLIVEEKNTVLNIAKWIVAFLILIAGIVINYHYVTISASIRASVGIVLVCVVLAVLATTFEGVRVRHFLQSVRIELRKVVWPTRPETVRMTMIIIAIVIVLSLVIWGVDALFLSLIRLITLS